MPASEQSVDVRLFSYWVIGGIIMAAVLTRCLLPSGTSRASDAATSAGATTESETIAPSELSPEFLYERVAPSVVTIVVKNDDGEPIGTGSGFFIDEALLSKPYDGLEID